MRTYLELVESFKEYRTLHEEPKTERVVHGHEEARGRSSTPGQVLAEVLATKEKGNSAIQQFLAQSEEILTNRRHSFKIDLKNPENSEATVGSLLTFKDAFERFLGECDLIRPGREGARDQE